MPSASAGSDTPGLRPRISLTTFTEYLAASAAARISCVQRQRETYGQQFVPGGDFYADIIHAIQIGRSSGADALAVQRAIAKQRDPARREHYQDLAKAWLGWLDEQPSMTTVAVGRATWSAPALDVGITPELALRLPDGQVQVIKLWLKAPKLSKDSTKAALRLMTLHMGQLNSGATPAVLDVRRGQLLLPDRRRLRKDYDQWLEAEASGFAYLWHAVGRRSA